MQQAIQLGGQVLVDVGELIRNRVGDRQGGTLPTDLTFGTYGVLDLGGGSGSLSVGSLALDKALGYQAALPSPDCCGDYGDTLNPDSIWIDISGFQTVEGQARNQCTGQLDVLAGLTSWWSGNTGVARVSVAKVTGVAPGYTTVDASGTMPVCSGNTLYWEDISVSAPVTVMPQILWNGTNITGTTQSAVVGQQIALTSSYSLPSGVTVTGQSWSVAGTTVGGYSASLASGATVPTNFSGASTTFYWVSAASSQAVTFTLSLSDSTIVAATATFNVAGPSAASASVALGTINIGNNKLEFGGSGSNVGIEFTPSASAPKGYSNAWVYVQVVSGVTVQLSGGTGHTCTGSGLDHMYPYPPATSTYTNDNPATGLSTSYTEETYTMSAQMYIMWSSGLVNSIPVPLGFVSWNWFGDAKYSGASWTLQPSSSRSAGAFQASSSYPTWTTAWTWTTCP